MSILAERLEIATKFALSHLLVSAFIALLAASLVFWVWYPHPYGQISGGIYLFFILVSVDVVSGPLLTLVLFNPKKPRREIVIDMGMVVLIQTLALLYGLFTVYDARPLFLVHDFDRFRIIAAPDYGGIDVNHAFNRLNQSVRPHFFQGPITVGIRDPKNAEERNVVLLESLAGGRDYAQRPEFYIPYDSAYQAKALAKAKPLRAFVEHYPGRAEDAEKLVQRTKVSIEQAYFLPVLHRQEWVAVMDAQASIIGFLPGDGFSVP